MRFSAAQKTNVFEVAVEDILSYNGNPYGLVYDNATMANELRKVNIHPIAYHLNSLRMVAQLGSLKTTMK